MSGDRVQDRRTKTAQSGEVGSLSMLGPIPPGLTFARMGQKVKALLHRESGVRLKDSPMFPVKAENVDKLTGMTLVTWSKIWKGDAPSDNVVRTTISRLNHDATLPVEVTFELMSDQTDLDSFCVSLHIPLRVSDAIRSAFDHPMRDMWPEPSNSQWQHSAAVFATMKGFYKFFRPGRDAHGNLGVVQGVMWVRSQIETYLGIETCVLLTTPKLEGEGCFSYTGRVIMRGTDTWWFFNQDDFMDRDYIVMATTTRVRNHHDHVGTFVSKDQMPDGRSQPIGSEVAIRRCSCKRAEASDEEGLKFLRGQARFWLDKDFVNDTIRLEIALPTSQPGAGCN